MTATRWWALPLCFFLGMESGGARGQATPPPKPKPPSDVPPATGPREPAPSAKSRSPTTRTPGAPTKDSNDATREMVRQLLMDVWNASADRTNRLGSAVLSRAQKAKAEMPEVEYAYGLVLMHQGNYENAVNLFRRITSSHPKAPMAWLALAMAQLWDGKTDAAVAALKSAIEVDSTFPATIETVAAVVTFYQAKPPARFRASKLKELEDTLFAQLSDDHKAHYRQAVARTKEYVGGLERQRQALMAPVEKLRADAENAEKEIRTMQQKRREEVERVAAWKEKQTEILLQRANVATAHDTSIAAAQASKNQTLVQQLLQQKLVAVSQFDNSLVAVENEITRGEQRIKALDRDAQALATRAKQWDAEARRLASEVESKLSLPPLPLTPDQERDRLLQSGSVFVEGKGAEGRSRGPQPAAKASPSEAEAAVAETDAEAATPTSRPAAAGDEVERKARNAFSLAETYRKNGKSEKARELYQKLIESYPDSKAAAEAKKALETLPDE